MTATTRDPLTPHADLKGLAVHDADDLLTGHVWSVLTESDTGLIRYLDLEVEGQNRHVLIPVGHARLEQSVGGERRIRLRAATLDDLAEIPAYDPQGWQSTEQASALLAAHGRLFRGDRYYAHPAFSHRGLYAGEHPIVPPSEAGPNTSDELQLLSEARDYQIAADQPNVVGFTLLDGQGEDAGVVEDLVIDTQALNARYLLVRTATARLLIPVGYVEIERSTVRMPGLHGPDLAALPHFDGMPLSRRTEQELLQSIEHALDARNPFLRVDYSDREMVA